MTAEAEVRRALVGEHVPVNRSVHFMAGRAAFDSGGFMLMKIRAALVRVALEAGFLLESAQSLPNRWFMGIMAGHAGENAFLETVLLVQIELGHHVTVADAAVLVGRHLEQ